MLSGSGTLLPGFAGPTLPPWLAERLRAGLAGVCLFGPNVESPAQLRALTDAVRAANPDAVVAVDEEGGDVTRLFHRTGSAGPGNAVLGRLDDLALTRADAVRTGQQLREAGCTVDFAPSVDINSNPDNPVIGVRSFGDDADLVARHGAAWVAGLQGVGVAATAKHFPGHGDTAQDSHVALPRIDRSLAQLRDRELVPFRAAVAAGVAVVMTSHVVLPQLDPEQPATTSRVVLQGLLRGELGFDGVIVSDALDMAGARAGGGVGETAVRALRAGCDLLCLGTETTEAELVVIERAVMAALADGSLEAARLDDAAARVRRLVAAVPAGEPASARPTARFGGRAVEDAVVVGAFDVQPGAAGWRERARDGYVVVRLQSEANVAVGATPWGPFAADPAGRLAAVFASRPRTAVTPARTALPPPGHPVLVVGRDIHRHAFARAAVDRLRARTDEVLVVDLGWPSPDRRYADVATFGASRRVGEALLAWLAG